ncbi:hypothetical protein GQR58_018991 [Nymphon striatum]|nr:hypothetical protein GQR58_018991 [Nymphon striatum]
MRNDTDFKSHADVFLDEDATQSEIADAVRCNCKAGCETQRCSCRKAGLDCSTGCGQCKGICLNMSAQITDDVDIGTDDTLRETTVGACEDGPNRVESKNLSMLPLNIFQKDKKYFPYSMNTNETCEPDSDFGQTGLSA